MNRYLQNEICRKLYSKYRKRIKKEETETEIRERGIFLKPSEVMKEYGENFERDTEFNAAVRVLEDLGFCEVTRVPYSDDITKLKLCRNAIPEMTLFANIRIPEGPTPADKIEQLTESYRGKGELTDRYIKNEITIRDTTNEEDAKLHKNMLKLLAFVQTLEEPLYVREVSMLVFGSSKVLEQNFLGRLCRVISQYDDITDEKEESADNGLLLRQWNILKNNLEILLKGNIILHFDGNVLDVSCFKDGIAIMPSDVERIKDVTINTERLVTVENKTAFYRCEDGNTVYVYLGGFADRYQKAFLRQAHDAANGRIPFFHFGDIDAGGFRIYRNLKDTTGIPFLMHHMGIDELQDEQFKECLLPLTENDVKTLGQMTADPEYGKTAGYMLQHNVKLEQEIVALHLFRENVF